MEKVINKNEEKMYAKAEALVFKINLEEIKDFNISKETLLEDIKSVLSWLDEIKEERGIHFVHGIGKRKTQIQKWTEQLLEYKKRKENYDTGRNLM